MRVFGIDAGMRAPGFCIVEVDPLHPPGRVLLAECFIPKLPKEVVAGKKNLRDIYLIRQTARRIWELEATYKPDVIVTELPTGGAKSFTAAKGMNLAIATTVTALDALAHMPNAACTEIVYISPIDNKKGSTGRTKWKVDPEQSKWEVLSSVERIWPGQVQWPRKSRGAQTNELNDSLCWGMADALGCVATYLRTNGWLEQASLPLVALRIS